MASVKYNTGKNDEIVSINIRVYKGRDANGKHLSPYTKTVKVPPGTNKKQLEKFVAKEVEKFEQECAGGYVENRNVLFRDLATEVMKLKKLKNLSPTTLSHYQDMLDDRILPQFGHMKVTAITVGHLNNFYHSLTLPGANKKNPEKGLSGKSIKEVNSLIRSILREAEKMLIITRNPADIATVPDVVYTEPNHYEEEDLEVIIQDLDTAPIKWKTIGYLLMLYGIRRGEAIGIKGRAIDFKRHTLTIETCVYYTKENGVFEKLYPKVKKIRVLPMTSETEQLLKEYLLWLDEEKAKYGDMWTESEFIFTAEGGGIMNPDNVTQYFGHRSKEQRKENENYPHLNPHAFRHTAASILINKGTDLVTAADYIGDSVRTMSRTYAHAMTKGKIQANTIMNNIVFNKNNNTDSDEEDS